MKCVERNRKKVYQSIAISLIVMSFVLYAIMPFNVCIPCSACTIAGITGTMMLVSEIIFWVGSLMIGREVALKIRKKFSIMSIIKHMREGRKGK